MKGRALRRALETKDVNRIGQDIPLIVDTTEMIDPEIAYAMLQRNTNNRPINWPKVEEYAATMAAGEWKLHAQGIILDVDGNILTGQKRLWAVIYSNCTVAMRISRGSPKSTAKLIDRHTPQTARDLASRDTGRKHGPTEARLARAILALQGNLKPTPDQVAAVIENRWMSFDAVLRGIAGTKRTKAVLMIIAAICSDNLDVQTKAVHVERMAHELDAALAPQLADRCWGRGAAFALAMKHAQRIEKGTA